MRYQAGTIAALVLSLPLALSALSHAEPLGQCPGADQVDAELKNSSSSGYYIPGLKLIIMNRAVLQAYSLPVQKFIFAHECAHSDPAVAEDEAAADCAAVKKGVSEGWIGKPEVIQICAHLARFPTDATHEPIPIRCRKIRMCSGLYEMPRPEPGPLEARKPEDVTPLTRLARTME